LAVLICNTGVIEEKQPIHSWVDCSYAEGGRNEHPDKPVFFTHRSIHPGSLRTVAGSCHADFVANAYRYHSAFAICDGYSHRDWNAPADIDAHTFFHPAPATNRHPHAGQNGSV
jgi:hypothetical protein